jgi:hypothetical protein
VRWAASLPDSNGAVGMFGVSYFGNTQWMAALWKPPELKAIAPAVTWSEPDVGLFSRVGVLELGISVYWSLLQGADTLLRRHADDPATLGGAIFGLIADIDDVAKTAYWSAVIDSAGARSLPPTGTGIGADAAGRGCC